MSGAGGAMAPKRRPEDTAGGSVGSSPRPEGPARPPARHGRALRDGFRDGIPIGLGYLAVSFSLGITARDIGLTPFQGFLASLLNNASAGEYAAFTLIAAGGSYLAMALVTLIANARYMLMSAAISQRFAPGTPLIHRILVGFDLTDELFGIAISRPGPLDPYYSYGAFAPALAGWSVGTALGIAIGNVLPARVASALSVALFGMFLAIIIPPARRDRVVLGLVVLSFVLSATFEFAPLFSQLSSGTRTIILTVGLSAAAAALFPVADDVLEPGRAPDAAGGDEDRAGHAGDVH